MNSTHSYAKGPTNIPLLNETIGSILKQTAQKYPDNNAITSVHQNYKATYGEFYDATTQVAKALLASGLANGDRVGIWSPNRYEWTLLQFATARIGIILVNLNPAYAANELAFVLQQASISAVFAPISFKASQYKDMLQAAIPTISSLKTVVLFEENWEEFLAQATSISEEQLSELENKVQQHDPVNIQYTSGTTGFPKGVTLSHHNIVNNGYFIGTRLNYTSQDKVCIPVPFYHCFGMVIGNMTCVAHGASMIIPNDGFDPEMTLHAVEKEECTSLYGVPTMFIAELETLKHKKYNLSSLRTGVMAGSPCPIEIMKKVQSVMNMSEVSICYGMTETSPVSTQTIIGTPIEKQVTTVGTVQDHLEIKIIDPETGELVPRNTPGEFCTKGYSIMLRYWNNPEATESVIDKDGWLHTGDLASMDEEGYINIRGRIKDIIIRGGENISPKEIEDFLYQHEAIVDVQIIGVPSEKYGEEVAAWVRIKDNHPIDEATLNEYCKQIAHFKRPKYWKFVNSFPMTVSGKIRKVEMRAISTQELGLDWINNIKTS